MKSFNQFLSESVTINGDFNGTLNIGGTSQQETVGEQFVADVVWQGSIYRIEMVTESGLPSKEKLTEHLQSQYPGAVVHQIYPVSETTNPYQIKDSKRYHPAKLEWI